MVSHAENQPTRVLDLTTLFCEPEFRLEKAEDSITLDSITLNSHNCLRASYTPSGAPDSAVYV